MKVRYPAPGVFQWDGALSFPFMPLNVFISYTIENWMASGEVAVFPCWRGRAVRTCRESLCTCPPPPAVPALMQCARVITKPKTRDKVLWRKQHQWKGHGELGLRHFPKSKQNSNRESSDTKNVNDVVVDLGHQMRRKGTAISGWIESLWQTSMQT